MSKVKSNRGLVVGTVYGANGKRAKGVTVAASRITGATGSLLDIEGAKGRFVITETDSDGTYALPFVWSGVEWADDFNVIWITLVAFNEEVSKSGYETSYVSNAKTKQIIKGVVKRDPGALVKIVASDLDSAPDIAEFAIDLAAELAEWGELVPFWKAVQMSGSENWMILGGANLFLSSD